MSKGDRRRRSQVSQKEVDRLWDLAFSKKEDKVDETVNVHPSTRFKHSIMFLQRKVDYLKGFKTNVDTQGKQIMKDMEDAIKTLEENSGR